DNRDALRPSRIKITITGDSTLADAKAVVYAQAPEWDWECAGLPKKDQGRDIAYTITEEEVSGYELTSVSKPGPYTGDTSDIDITNTHNPAVVTIEGDKIWDDDYNRDHVRPESITVKLMVGSEIVDSQTVYGDMTAESWHWKFPYDDNKTIPRYRYDNSSQSAVPIEYTVEEVANFTNADKYTAYPATAGTKDASGNISGIEIRNKHIIETVNISGRKIWKDDLDNDHIEDRDGLRPGSIRITLYANNNVASVEGVTNPVVATATGNWSWSFEGLPKNDANGKEIHYSVREEEIEGYTGGGPAEDPLLPSNYGTTTVSGNVTDITGVEFTNTHTPDTVNFSGTKVWEDDSDRDGYRPDTISLHLFQNNVEIDWPVTFTDNGNNTWTWNYTGLPKYSDHGNIINVYRVEEDKVEHYEAPEYSGVGDTTITNRHTPDPVNIKVVKVWDDNENQDGKRNENTKIVFHLLADGVEIDSCEVGEADNWTHTFENLNKYRDHQTLIVYSVTEDKYSDYSLSDTAESEENGTKVFT
ncbi:MAG: Cna B-type domain-containing protein, partial [Lachnospiraceae bacterium]|nr:Cna B-type domain-containing protein [Lachnospiraceae bacterium]